MRSSRCLLEAFPALDFASGESFDGLGEACGWGERVACGAWDGVGRLFLDEPSVTELLLRRSLLPLLFDALFGLDEAFLLHADSTAMVTLCCTRPVRRLGAGINEIGRFPMCVESADKGELVEERPSTCGRDAIDRVWCVVLPIRLNCGSRSLWVRGWWTSVRHDAPTVKPTFLLIICSRQPHGRRLQILEDAKAEAGYIRDYWEEGRCEDGELAVPCKVHVINTSAG